MSIKEKYKGTYFAFINCLWSLIPIFHVFSIYFGVFLEKEIRGQGYSVAVSCKITAVIFCALSLLSASLYYRGLFKSDTSDKKLHRSSFIGFCILEYVLINNLILLMAIEPEIWISVKKAGEIVSVMYELEAGLLASMSLIILGILFDLTCSYKKPVSA